MKYKQSSFYALWSLLLLSLASLLVQCETPPEAAGPAPVVIDPEPQADPTPEPEKRPAHYYAKVDRLRLREAPELQAKVVTMVEEGAKLQFLNEVSAQTETLELRGETITAPFLKVQTEAGKQGWVFEGALSQTPVESVVYRVAIGYRHLEEGEEDISGDWGYYANEAAQEVKDLNIEFIYPEEAELSKVMIRDNNGKVIGVENVKALFEEEGAGYVLIEKGRKPGFVVYDMSMGGSIRAYFEEAAEE